MPVEERGLSSRPGDQETEGPEIGASLSLPRKASEVSEALTAPAVHQPTWAQDWSVLSESRVREIRMHGSMSGVWKRGMEAVVRHRQSKEPATAEADPKPPRHTSTLRAP